MRNKLLHQELLEVFRNRKLLIPIIAVLFIPVLYSGMFLWAFWDPYEQLADLPVAVSNSDSGANLDGEEIELGKDLAEKLEKSKDFNFTIVDEEKGEQGLKQQKYYMLIKIPEDFSENATTLLDDSPQKLEIIYMPNESYNFLSAQIGETAAERIKASVSEKVSETYAQTMFDKIGDLAAGLEAAGGGAADIHDGAEQLTDGSNQLYENLSVLAGKSLEFEEGMGAARSGIEELASGAVRLSAGLGELETGSGKLASSSSELLAGGKGLADGIGNVSSGLQTVTGKLPALLQGTERAKKGSEDLATNLQAWKTGAGNASVGAAELQAGIQELQKQMEQMQPLLSAHPEQQQKLAEAMQKLSAGSAGLAKGTEELSSSAGQLASGAEAVAGGLNQLAVGQSQLEQGISALAAGSIKLEKGAGDLAAGQEKFHTGITLFGEKLSEAKTGSEKLAEGSAKLAGGMNQLSDGSSAMADGAGQLASGAEKLSAGNEKVAEGASELANKLADGAEKASINPDDETYNMLAEPVDLANEKLNPVPNYGTGFAPYFLSLGLFVGALLLSIVFPLTEPAGVPTSGFSWFKSKFVILAGIGIIQALLSDAILLKGLGLQVQSVPLFLVFSIVTSLTFIALIQFLVTLLGDPGRFVAIVILILQLTTSAGTFPLELIPMSLQKFNALLPMTYSVQGFKAVISSGDYRFMWQNAGILTAYIVVLAAGTWLYFHWMFKRKFTMLNEK